MSLSFRLPPSPHNVFPDTTESPLAPHPPTVSSRRLREIARDRRAEADGLERHVSHYQDTTDRNTLIAQQFVAHRASVLRTEATELERLAREVSR